MPSRVWYVLCLVVVIAGIVGGVRALRRFDEQIASMPRMIIPGSHTFELAPGDYVIYGESQGVIEGRSYENDQFTFETACTLVDASGRSIELDPISIHNAAKYRRARRRGKSMFDTTIPTAGRYTLGCDGDGTGDAIVAVGPGVRGGAAVMLLMFAGGPGIGIAGALYLYFRRRKAVQRARG